LKKGRDYERLEERGLPIPLYGVFDSSCLEVGSEADRLSEIVNRILTSGSGKAAVRTEPKGQVAALANYPHLMPLLSLKDVADSIKRVTEDHPGHDWWFLINEAFTEYQWNAVVMATDRLPEPGGPRLIGEVNEKDNVPLREALGHTANCVQIQDWHEPDVGKLRTMIIDSGLLNEWIEVSAVYSKNKERIVFWGMR